ncbi:hypothetical protein HK099_006826 [Clydaea vesicula]|uniref:Uncharacterized protein n=1 Tax=Clydaea vesicula TaxID=447962 RepID=A0AAD5U221_9FUNG|nr:hypothetical protein HK099_006826 [Clydaea vesicula]KAJ3383905.1 hypothetical protein HDU92_003886 [Lobulomyces angularis]
MIEIQGGLCCKNEVCVQMVNGNPVKKTLERERKEKKIKNLEERILSLEEVNREYLSQISLLQNEKETLRRQLNVCCNDCNKLKPALIAIEVEEPKYTRISTSSFKAACNFEYNFKNSIHRSSENNFYNEKVGEGDNNEKLKNIVPLKSDPKRNNGCCVKSCSSANFFDPKDCELFNDKTLCELLLGKNVCEQYEVDN